jgi:hypothetical protein
MRRATHVIICGLGIIALWGCPGQPEIVLDTNVKPAPVEEPQKFDDEKAWAALAVESIDDPRQKPVFIRADDAEACPTIKVMTLSGEKMDLRPPAKGKITIYVFWLMEMPAARAAAVHVRDLQKKYARLGVDAIGIVERPPGSRSYKAAPGYMSQNDITYPTYYDDFSALQKMGRAANENPRENVPCFFIVDRQRRVRFFKRGFSPTMAGSVQPRIEGVLVIENAAEGEHIEDYLKALIRER